MPNKPLHIISFDNPFPPVYGGVIDVFYKIKALHGLGFDIYLHCTVDHEIEPAPELLQYVAQAYFYRRNKKNVFHMLSRFPFGVISRYDKKMVDNIAKIDAPILFEGLQTTYLLRKHDFSKRKLILRLHNLEANYYEGAYRSETNFFRKHLFWLEALRYRPYQEIIGKFDSVLTLSVFETEYVQQHFHNAIYVPVFHGNVTVLNLDEFGQYALYHGDLRLPDNLRAADFVIRVFSQIPDFKLVIASAVSNPVKQQIQSYNNISYVQISDQQHLDELLRNAHINVMLSFQESGTKLKLVNALFKSRYCIINRNMVDEPRLQDLCAIAETESEFIDAVNDVKLKPWMMVGRNNVLHEVLNDVENAKKIVKCL